MNKLTDSQKRLLDVMKPGEWCVASQLRKLSGLSDVEIVSDPFVFGGLIDNLYGHSTIPWYKLTPAGVEFKKGQE